MKSLIWMGCWVLTVCWIAGAALPAQETSDDLNPKPFHRKIFVPFDSLEILLDGNSNRVLLTRQEYAALLESARTREIKRAPLDSAIVSANYVGIVSDNVVSIKGELIVEPLNDGLVQIPLPINGVAIRSAMLDGKPAMLWRTDEGQVVLLAAGQSRQTLRLEMNVPLQTTAARQSLTMQVPAPSATRFSLTVPGNVEIKSGVPVASRVYDERSDATEFDLLASRKPMNIVMSLNNRLLKDESVTVSRSVLIHKLTPHRQEMHLTCSVDVVHGALNEMEFAVPDGFQVSSVETESLSQWEIDNSGGTGSRLVVKLRQPVREDFVLSVIASKDAPTIGSWQAEDIRPLNVAGHVSVVGVLVDTQMKSAKLASQGVIPIDHEFLLAAIPDSVKSTDNGNVSTIIAAFYAPQQEYSISSSFSVPNPELIVRSNARLIIRNQELELQGGISLISRNDSRFGFKIGLPESWRLNELKDVDGRPLRFDRVGTVEQPKFLVYLPTRIPADAAIKVFFNASRTPDGWLESWDENTIEFPSIDIADATEHSGALAIASDDDLSIKPGNLVNLELLDETEKKKFELDRDSAPLAYQFKDPDYQLQLNLERLTPSKIARTFNFVTIQPTQLVVHTELIYDVKRANEGEFKFDLPLNSPKSISIRAANDVLKDYQSQDTETARRWTVQLAKPRKGQVHFMVDYQVPLEEQELAELQLTPVVAQDVSFQTSMFAVEGSTELDIEITTSARSVDIGEFSQAVYQPGRHLLGAFSWPGEDLTVTVNCLRRPIYPLPNAIVQRAEMVTSISNNGKAQTAARFLLVVKQQPFLRVDLPENATLWSVRLDGQPAKPQRQNGNLLISLLGNESGKLRDLQLVFESPAERFRLVGQIQAQAPVLWLNETRSQEQGTPVPLVDLHWRLLMPDGFSVSHNAGEFQSDQLTQRPSPIQQLGRWLYMLGGGIGDFGYGVNVTKIMATSDEVSGEYLPMSPANEAYKLESDFSNLGLRGGVEIPRQDMDLDSLFTAVEPGSAIGLDDISKLEPNQTGMIAAPGQGGPANAPVTPQQAQQAPSNWALSGLRSLNISLIDTGNSIDFYNLGETPTLNATIVDHSRLNWIAIALSFLIAAIGVMLTNRYLKSKAAFIILILVAACLVPLAGETFDAFRTIVDLAILSAVFVAIYFVVAGVFKILGQTVTRWATRIPVVLLLMTISLAWPGTSYAQQVVNDVAELKDLIDKLHTRQPVSLPDDAIIVPFDPNDPEGRKNADRLLLPYEHYLALINKVELDETNRELESPVEYVLSSAQYDAQLTTDDDITIVGKLVIDLMTDDPVAVALPIFGGALADAKVDGNPAKLQFQPHAGNPPAQQKGQTSESASVIKLHLEGKGTKTFEFTVRIKPARQGGWRVLNARLPIGMTRGLNLTSMAQPTEIRLSADADRRTIEAQPNQTIATVLSENGSLRLQWKPSSDNQTVDQSLTAKSEAVFDVREDGLRLNWFVDLDFRGAERDGFTFNIPPGFLVEQVTGENVRAWEIKQQAGQNQLVVTQLSPAKDQESFAIELSRRDFSVDSQRFEFDAPYLTVAGAALHQGTYIIRRSPIIELKNSKSRAVSRVDSNQVKTQLDLKIIDAQSSPLGIQPFQAMRFVTTPFQLTLQANLVPQTIDANTQSILRVGQTQADLESRINIDVGQRPIYKLELDLPAQLEIKNLNAGLDETWTSESIDDVQRVQLYFPSGVADDFAILLTGELTEYTGESEWAIPKLRVNGATREEGVFAIQVDPALTVTTTNRKDCEPQLLQRVEGWLNRDQRSSTRLVLKTKGHEYGATLQFTRIEPRVSVETVTNVRTTLFAIEETILLDFNIQQAGIRQIQFEIPASLRNARINAKLVSETTIEDVENSPEQIRVTLDLQDDVIDSFRVVIENDRQLDDAPQRVPIPNVLTGTTEQRYVTLQNAGRDEINVLPSTSFQALNRQLKQFSKLKQKLAGGEVTMAYVANPQSEGPVIQFQTRQREALDTVAASIEFSKTVMVVDSGGAYRALQIFQVNNRSEQYLEIELPEAAQLLTVLVEGQPVKPVAWPNANQDRRVRIPLLKTQMGDLDYPVQLKYAGSLGDLSGFGRIEFPVIETLNINVQSSQLHLRLPDTYRWMNFGGTMTQVDDRGELEESFLSYKGRQIQQLAEQLGKSTSQYGSFARKRAFSNLQQLQQEMVEFESVNSDLRRHDLKSDLQVSDLVEGNNAAIQRAQELYTVNDSDSIGQVIDNRANFNGLVEDQSARIGRNSINKLGQNFRFDDSRFAKDQTVISNRQSGIQSDAAGAKGQKFDSKWLDRNQLNTVPKPSTANAPQGMTRRSISEGETSAPSWLSQNRQSLEAIVDNSVGFASPVDVAKNKTPIDLNGRLSLGNGLQRSGEMFGDTQEEEGKYIGGQGGAGFGREGAGSVASTESEPNAVPRQEQQSRGTRIAGGLGGPALADSPFAGQGPAGVQNQGAFLSSLDINLPERGTDFYFKSPRGKATVVVRPIESRFFSRSVSVLVTLGICLGGLLVGWFVIRTCQSSTVRLFALIGLLLGGLVSFIGAILPVFGFLAIIGSIAMLIDRRSQTSAVTP